MCVRYLKGWTEGNHRRPHRAIELDTMIESKSYHCADISVGFMSRNLGAARAQRGRGLRAPVYVYLYVFVAIQ